MACRYKCDVCGYEFDVPMEIIETHGFVDGMYEHFQVCPRCSEGSFSYMCCDDDDEEEEEYEE